MFGSTMLEVGIGLALIFGFFALIVTTLRESIESVLKSRSRTLERAIREMLGPTMTQRLYQHPLVCGLYRGRYIPWSPEPNNTKWSARLWHRLRRWAWRNRPSYIPARTFALAMLDVVGRVENNVPWGGRVIAARRNVATALIRAPLNNGNARNNPPADTNAPAALRSIIDASGLDHDRTVTEIMDWYTGAMDRASGWYKRLTGRIVFLLSLAIVVGFNVDAIKAARTLYSDPGVRSAIVARAGSAQAPATETLDTIQLKLNGIQLPIGQRHEKNWSHAIGLLLSAVAISLGAPFWFDLLNKMMMLRSTLKPLEPSKDGVAADRTGASPSVPGKPAIAPPFAGPVPGGFPPQQNPIGPGGVGSIG